MDTQTPAVTGVILAGGDSTRLRARLGPLADKGLLPLGGQTMAERVSTAMAQVCPELICITDREEYRRMGLRLVPDRLRRGAKNALTGIHAGLSAAESEYSLVVACDMPFLRAELLRYLVQQVGGHDIIIPRVAGRWQPLCAVYSRRCLPYIEAQLRANTYRIVAFFPQVRILTLEEPELRNSDPDLRSFININTAADYAAAVEWIARGADPAPPALLRDWRGRRRADEPANG